MSSALWNYRINAAAWRSLLMTATVLAIAGCAGSKTVQTKTPEYTAHSARTLAIAPSNDLFVNDSAQLADTIGVELRKRGYSVVDTNGTTALLAKYNIAPVDGLAPQALTAFGKDGVDAIVSVNSKAADIGGPGMRYVKATVTSARTSKEIGVINWTNSWGGMPGSLADHMARKSPAAAAQEIADALANLLG
jgi:hypothetical protein